jgi:hypothetical protein
MARYAGKSVTGDTLWVDARAAMEMVRHFLEIMRISSSNPKSKQYARFQALAIGFASI